MNKYLCEGFRPVMAQGFGEAAGMFAQRASRKKYGPNGCAFVTLLDSSKFGLFCDYSSFICKPDQVRSGIGQSSVMRVYLCCKESVALIKNLKTIPVSVSKIATKHSTNPNHKWILTYQNQRIEFFTKKGAVSFAARHGWTATATVSKAKQ